MLKAGAGGAKFIAESLDGIQPVAAHLEALLHGIVPNIEVVPKGRLYRMRFHGATSLLRALARGNEGEWPQPGRSLVREGAPSRPKATGALLGEFVSISSALSGRPLGPTGNPVSRPRTA